jgi:hypothetical protein
MKFARWIAVLVPLLVMAGCETEDEVECDTCVLVPEAQVVDDGQPTGVYKGILAAQGKSGTIKAVIATDLSGAMAEIRTGGLTYRSTGFDLSMSAVQEAGVTYTMTSMDFTLILTLGPDGEVLSAGLILGGIGCTVSVEKETSTDLASGYEGTFWGTRTGTFNMVIRGGRCSGVSMVDDGPAYNYTGTVSGSGISINVPDGSGGASGTLSKDRMSASGTWRGGDEDSGNWKGRRTL